MLFRPTIGTWCKGTTFMGGTEKVVIAITCNLLATYLQLTSNNSLHFSATSLLAIRYAREDFSRE